MVKTGALGAGAVPEGPCCGGTDGDSAAPGALKLGLLAEGPSLLVGAPRSVGIGGGSGGRKVRTELITRSLPAPASNSTRPQAQPTSSLFSELTA
jgi:hypothetical protein